MYVLCLFSGTNCDTNLDPDIQIGHPNEFNLVIRHVSWSSITFVRAHVWLYVSWGSLIYLKTVGGFSTKIALDPSNAWTCP